MSLKPPGQGGGRQDACPPNLVGKILFDDEVYDRRFRALQAYLPLVESLMNRTEGKCSFNDRRTRLQSLSAMLVDFNAKMKEETLAKCEVVLHKLSQKVEVNSTVTAPDPEKSNAFASKPSLQLMKPTVVATPAWNSGVTTQIDTLHTQSIQQSDNSKPLPQLCHNENDRPAPFSTPSDISMMRTLKLAAARTARNADKAVNSPEPIKCDDQALAVDSPSSLERSRDKLKKLLPKTSQICTSPLNVDVYPQQLNAPECESDGRVSKPPSHWNPSPPRQGSKEWKVLDEYVHEDDAHNGSGSSRVSVELPASLSSDESKKTFPEAEQSVPQLQSINQAPTIQTCSAKSAAQGIRAKLEQEISKVHRVGTSTGGSLRALMNKDNRLKLAASSKEMEKSKTTDKYVEIDMFSKEDLPMDKKTKEKTKEPIKSLKGMYAPRFGNAVSTPDKAQPPNKSKVPSPVSDKVESKERSRVVKSPIRFPVNGVTELKKTVVVPLKSSAFSPLKESTPQPATDSDLPGSSEGHLTLNPNLKLSAKNTSILGNMTQEEIKRAVDLNLRDLPSPPPIPAEILERVNKITTPFERPAAFSRYTVNQEQIRSVPVKSFSPTPLAIVTQHVDHHDVDLRDRTQLQVPISDQPMNSFGGISKLDRNFLLSQTDVDLRNVLSTSTPSCDPRYNRGPTSQPDLDLRNFLSNTTAPRCDPRSNRTPLLPTPQLNHTSEIGTNRFLSTNPKRLQDEIQESSKRHDVYNMPARLEHHMHQQTHKLPQLQQQPTHLKELQTQHQFQPHPVNHSNHSVPNPHQEHHQNRQQHIHRPEYSESHPFHEPQRDFHHREEDRRFFQDDDKLPSPNDFNRDNFGQHDYSNQWHHRQDPGPPQPARRQFSPWERPPPSVLGTFQSQHQSRIMQEEFLGPRNQEYQQTNWHPATQDPRGSSFDALTRTPRYDANISISTFKDSEHQPRMRDEKYQWASNASLLSPPRNDPTRPIHFYQQTDTLAASRVHNASITQANLPVSQPPPVAQIKNIQHNVSDPIINRPAEIVKQPTPPAPSIIPAIAEPANPRLPIPRPERAPPEKRPLKPTDSVRPINKINSNSRPSVMDRQFERRRRSVEQSEKNNKNSKRPRRNFEDERRKSSGTEYNSGRRNSADQRKETKDLISPLNSLYDSSISPRTGKGYGLQSFKIPKIKRDLAPVHNVPDDPPPVLKRVSLPSPPMPQVTSSTDNLTFPVTPSSTCGPVSVHPKTEPVNPAPSTTADSNANIKDENLPVPSTAATDEVISPSHMDQEFVESLISNQLTVSETKELLEYVKVLRKKFKSKKFKKLQRIFQCNSDDSDDESVEEEKTAKTIDRKLEEKEPLPSNSDVLNVEAMAISETLDQKPVIQSENTAVHLLSPEPDNADANIVPLNVVPSKSNRTARPRSKKKNAEEASKGDADEGCLLISDEDAKEVTDVKPERKPRVRRRNSLEILQDDIRDMFMSEGVLTSSGRRLCTILKQDVNHAVKVMKNTETIPECLSTDEESDTKASPVRIQKRGSRKKLDKLSNQKVHAITTAKIESTDSSADDCRLADADEQQFPVSFRQSFTKTKVKKKVPSEKQLDKSFDNLLNKRKTRGSKKSKDDDESSSHFKSTFNVLSSSDCSDDNNTVCPRPTSKNSPKIKCAEYSSGDNDIDEFGTPKRVKTPVGFYKYPSSSEDEAGGKDSKELATKRTSLSKKSVRKPKTTIMKKAKYGCSESDDASIISFPHELEAVANDKDLANKQSEDTASQLIDEASKKNNGLAICGKRSLRVSLEKLDYSHLLPQARPFSSSSDESVFESIALTRKPGPMSRCMARRGCRKFNRFPTAREVKDTNSAGLDFGNESSKGLKQNLQDIIARLSTEEDFNMAPTESSELQGNPEEAFLQPMLKSTNALAIEGDSDSVMEEPVTATKKKNLSPRRKRKSTWSCGKIKKTKRSKVPVEAEKPSSLILTVTDTLCLESLKNLDSNNDEPAKNIQGELAGSSTETCMQDVVAQAIVPMSVESSKVNEKDLLVTNDLTVTDGADTDIIEAASVVDQEGEKIAESGAVLDIGDVRLDLSKENGLANKEQVENCEPLPVCFEEPIKNVDCNYVFHEDKPACYSCKLCCFNGKAIVLHYTHVHPTQETYISRLPIEDAQNAIAESKDKNYPLNPELPDGKVAKRRRKSTMFTCRICFSKMQSSVSFYDHCCSHTGEYRYKCNKCGGKIPTKAGFHSHVRYHHFHLKGVEQIACSTLHEMPNDVADNMYGYICSRCNFVQMQRANVESHIKHNHQGETDVTPVCINMHVQTTKTAICKRRKKSVDAANVNSVNEDLSEENASDQEIQLDHDNISTSAIDQSAQDVNLTVFVPTDSTLDLEEEKTIQDKRKNLMEEITKKLSDRPFMASSHRRSLVDVLSSRDEENPEVSPAECDLTNNTVQVDKDGSNNDSLLDTQQTAANQGDGELDPLHDDHPMPALHSIVFDFPELNQTALGLSVNEDHCAVSSFGTKRNQKVMDLIERVKQSTFTNSVGVDLSTVTVKKENLEEDEYFEVDDPSEVIFRVGPFAVKRLRGSRFLACSVQDCIYKTMQPNRFVSHVRKSHPGVDWDGYCQACCLLVNNEDQLESAALHLLKNHLLTAAQQHSAFPPTIQDATAKNIESGTRLRIRKLSGDMLSAAKDPTKPAEEDDNEFMGCVIANVVSLADEANQDCNMRHIEDKTSAAASPLSPPLLAKSVAALLPGQLVNNVMTLPHLVPFASQQPHKLPQVPNSEFSNSTQSESTDSVAFWRTLKTEPSYQRMLEHKKLRHLFKCMNMVCSFTTNSRTSFAFHLQTHAVTRAVYHCAYCKGLPLPRAKDIMDHIVKTHSYCMYQCAYCFYRAAYTSYIVVHQNTNHTSEQIRILECIPCKGLVVPNVSWQLKSNLVLPYICKQSHCDAQFYITDQFIAHMRARHSQDHIFSCYICEHQEFDSSRLVRHFQHFHGIEHYQCGHCIQGTKTEEAMHVHMCETHPSLPPTVVVRELAECDNVAASLIRDSPITQLKVINLELTYQADEKVIVKPSLLELLDNENRVKSLPETHVKIIDCNSDDELVVVDDGPEEASETNPFETVDVEEAPLLEDTDACEQKTAIHENTTPAVTSRLTRSSPKKALGNMIEDNTTNKLAKKSPQEKKAIGKEAVAKASKPAGSFEFGAITTDELSKTGLAGSDLYKCGYNNCEFESSDNAELREHILCCDLSRDSDTLNCPHCQRGVKTMPLYLEHLKSHATMRYGCGLCTFRATSNKFVTVHLKSRHRAVHTRCIPLNPVRSDPEADLFVIGPLKDKSSKWNRKKSLSPAKAKPKFVYQADEGHLLPIGNIYPYIVTCATCSFTTKVRINMQRHLALHISGEVAPSQTPLNAVPCLEKNEMMFDKMTNLAASSNVGAKQSDAVIEPADLIQLPKYVPEQERYVCGAQGCTYSSCDESMLLHHLRALHRDLDVFECPHCVGDQPAIPIDKLGVHLKMHDTQLYKCGHCLYFDFRRHVVERHLAEKHKESKSVVLVVRDLGSDTPPDSEATAEENDGLNNWRCGMCDFGCPTRSDIIAHTSEAHGMRSQFKCGECNYRSQSRHGFDNHYTSKHSGSKMNIIHLYYRFGTSTTTEHPGFDTSPLWSRDLPRVKHIRGILFDEEPDAPPAPKVADPVLPVEPEKPDDGSFYMCSLCEVYQTRYKSDFKLHLFKELKYMRFMCSVCGKKTCYRSHMRKHISRSHPKKGNFVNLPVDKTLETYVDRVIETKESLMQMDVTQKRPAKSSSAKKTKAKVVAAAVEELQSDADLVVVENLVKNEPKKKRKQVKSSKPKKYPCPRCKKLVRTVRGLKLHIRLRHLSNGRWRCHHCEQSFDAKCFMEAHCRTVHPEVTDEPFSLNTDMEVDRVLYDDDFWQREFNIGPDFEEKYDNGPPLEQIAALEPMQPVVSFVAKPAVKASKNKLQCRHCDHRSKSIAEMKRHEVIHMSPPAPHKCEMCPYATVRKADLKRHCSQVHSVPTSSQDSAAENDSEEVNMAPEWLDVNDLADFRPNDEPTKQFDIELSDVSDDGLQSWTDRDVTFRCGYCLESGSSAVVTVHQKKTHPMLPLLIEEIQSTVELRCDRCQLPAVSLTALYQHAAQCRAAASALVSVFHCPECKYTSRQNRYIKEHLLIHAKSFACGYCGVYFSFFSRARTHIATAHPGLEQDIKSIPEGKEQYESLKARVVKTKEKAGSRNNTARKSTTPHKRYRPPWKCVARKSTGNSPRKLVTRAPYSAYGNTRFSVPAGIIVRTTLDSSLVNIDFAKYSQLINVDPVVVVSPLRL